MSSNMTTFSGTNSSPSSFFDQFEIIAALNNWSEETKGIILASYLSGPALSFYRSIYVSSKKYIELRAEITAEFGDSTDPVAEFYCAKQLLKESLLEFTYRLELLAKKASIDDDKTIIKQCLKGQNYYNKKIFAGKIYSSFKDLKNCIRQYDSTLNPNMETIELPIKIKNTQVLNNSSGDNAIHRRGYESSPQDDAYRTPIRSTPFARQSVIRPPLHQPSTSSNTGTGRGQQTPHTGLASRDNFRYNLRSRPNEQRRQ